MQNEPDRDNRGSWPARFFLVFLYINDEFRVDEDKQIEYNRFVIKITKLSFIR
jgi:hypothetical protein